MHTETRETPSHLTEQVRAPGVSIPHVAAFFLVWAAIHALLVVVRHPDVLGGAQVDPDGYMRLVRVRHLLQTHAWFDNTIPESNWPFGEVHHWTRPLDVLIIALYAPLRLILDPPTALSVAGSLISPVCHFLTCVAAVWTVSPLVAQSVRHYAMPAVLAQPVLLSYGVAGRADHHALILLLMMLALGAWIRALFDPGDRRAAIAAGVLSATGIWVSPESLLPFGVLLVTGAFAWITGVKGSGAQNARFAASFLIALVLGVIVERPFTEWLNPDADRISLIHVTVGALAITFWLAVSTAPMSNRLPVLRRLTVVMVGAVLAAAALIVFHPHFFKGPWADVDSAVISVWLQRVSELQPLLPSTRTDIGRFVANLGAAVIVVPVIAWWLKVDSGQRRPVWFMLLLSLLIYTPLAAFQLRFAGLAGIVIAVAIVVTISSSFESIAGLGKQGVQAISRVALVLALLGGFMGIGALAGGVAARTAGTPRPEPASCRISQMSQLLADTAGLGARPRTIATYIDFGPEILYRTPHRVLAGPYHRNADGILAAHSLFSGTDMTAAMTVVREREIDWLLICPPVDTPYYSSPADSSLHSRLTSSAWPSWIVPVDLPAHAPSEFMLFAVDLDL